MDGFFSSSKEMVTAQRKAMAELKAMSFEELMQLSEENMDSPTVEFLLCCNSEKPLQQIVTQEDKLIVHEHYAVAMSSRCLEGLKKHFVAFAASTAHRVQSDTSQGFALGGSIPAMAA
ncbi:hypothetical protein PSGK_21000 [Pseudomonas solani]|uniref:hypothetical protein n=1 Tax=Pseudomonas solani TaxID=2731552 RepID=UPI0035BE6B30